MPLKTTSKIALGRVTGGYRYTAEQDPNKRHVVDVKWIRTDLSRTAVKQDLLFTLGSIMSIFAPSKNDAVTRLERLLADGADPGAVSESSLLSSTLTRSGEENAVDEPEQSAEYRATSTRQDREKDRGRRRWPRPRRAGHRDLGGRRVSMHPGTSWTRWWHRYHGRTRPSRVGQPSCPGSGEVRRSGGFTCGYAAPRGYEHSRCRTGTARGLGWPH
jgi:hypothetical protein